VYNEKRFAWTQPYFTVYLYDIRVHVVAIYLAVFRSVTAIIAISTVYFSVCF